MIIKIISCKEKTEIAKALAEIRYIALSLPGKFHSGYSNEIIGCVSEIADIVFGAEKANSEIAKEYYKIKDQSAIRATLQELIRR